MDRRQYNFATASEVAAVMPGDGSEDVASREMRFYLRQGGIGRITEYNAVFMLLHFLLLYARGGAWREPGIPLDLPTAGEQAPGRPLCSFGFGSTRFRWQTSLACNSSIRPETVVSFAIACRRHVGVLSCPWLSYDDDLQDDAAGDGGHLQEAAPEETGGRQCSSTCLQVCQPSCAGSQGLG